MRAVQQAAAPDDTCCCCCGSGSSWSLTAAIMAAITRDGCWFCMGLHQQGYGSTSGCNLLLPQHLNRSMAGPVCSQLLLAAATLRTTPHGVATAIA